MPCGCGERPSAAHCDCFSDFVRVRDFGMPADSASVEGGWCWYDEYGRWLELGYGLNNVPTFESLDCVLDELYDDRWSTEMIDPGVSVVLGVIGELEMPFTEDDVNVRVSSINVEPLDPLLASLFDDGCRRRNTDFHECELGLCAVVDVCILIAHCYEKQCKGLPYNDTIEKGTEETQ